MTVRYVTSMPNWTYKLFIRNAEGKMNHAILTGEDSETVHTTVAEYIQDNIGWETLSHITKKPLSDEYGPIKEVEVSKNYLMGLLY
tara:strand:- start:473 stop:730 length:258 start_codon:yes stop_codon:yes gene_type:complete